MIFSAIGTGYGAYRGAKVSAERAAGYALLGSFIGSVLDGALIAGAAAKIAQTQKATGTKTTATVASGAGSTIKVTDKKKVSSVAGINVTSGLPSSGSGRAAAPPVEPTPGPTVMPPPDLPQMQRPPIIPSGAGSVYKILLVPDSGV